MSIVRRNPLSPTECGIPVDFLEEIRRQANRLNKTNDICKISAKNYTVRFDWSTREQLRNSNVLTNESMASVDTYMAEGGVIVVLMPRPGHVVISAFRALDFRGTRKN